MSLPNADAAIAAGVIDSQGYARPITVHNDQCSMPRIGLVSVRALLFPGSSLFRDTALIGALAGGHGCDEVSI